MRVYWANAMFGEADRHFNQACAAYLRDEGFEVVLPQEKPINLEKSPAEADIFLEDTRAILDCDAVVACLDSESIDAGVAAEVGLAYAAGVPVVGLCTDMRQHRKGPGQMYKNLYVTGLIRVQGTLASNLEAVRLALHRLMLGRKVAPDRFFADVAGSYDSFIEELEGWYKPSWSPVEAIISTLGEVTGLRILDFGCGTGQFTKELSRLSGREVIGFDEAGAMISVAASQGSGAKFTSDWHQALQARPFDLFTTNFVAHDVGIDVVLGRAHDAIQATGDIIVIDLGSNDMGNLIEALLGELALPKGGRDCRLTPPQVARSASKQRLELVTSRTYCPEVTFPSAQALERYTTTFGILEGMDWPERLTSRLSSSEGLFKEIVGRLQFPFTDIREFHLFHIRPC